MKIFVDGYCVLENIPKMSISDQQAFLVDWCKKNGIGTQGVHIR